MSNINAPIYRVYLTHITGGSHEAFPYGFDGMDINGERQTFNNEDSVFVRRFLDGDFLFKNKPATGITDFDWILSIENGTSSCSKIEVEVKRSCDGGLTFVNFWNGSFTTADGTFDLDECEFKTKLKPEDIYQCIFDGADTPFNIIKLPNEYTVIDTGEVATYEYYAVESTLCGGATAPPHYTMFWTDCDGIDSSLYIFYREYRWTNCIAGIPYPPAGINWFIEINNCATTGMAKYVRVPLSPPPSPYTGNYVVESSCNGGEPVNPNDFLGPQSPYWELIYYHGQPGLCTTASWWFNNVPNPSVVNYTHTRGIPETLTAVAQNACPDIFGVCSDFLSINPVGDAPGYLPGYNYVTGDVQKIDQLFISAKSDILLPLATNPASVANLTFNELMSWMQSMFNVRWWITRSVIPNQNVLRIEHVKYFNYAVQVNLTVAPFAKLLNGTNSYSRINDKRPRREIYKWMEAKSADFVGADIVYNFDCVDATIGGTRGGNLGVDRFQSNSVTYSADGVTTDIPFITTNPSEISSDGFVIMAAIVDSGNFYMLNEAGLISGNVIQNGHLSWANLHYNYHRYNRVLLQGLMNNNSEIFFTAKPTKEQGNVTIFDCCGGIDDDVNSTEIIGTFTTGLGNGIMDNYRKNLKDDTIILKLLY